MVHPRVRWSGQLMGFVATWHVRRFVRGVLPVSHGAQRGRTTLPLSGQGAHWPQDRIRMGGRGYVASPLSDRPVEELLEERGVPVDHATMQRGVVPYRPLWEAAFHRRQRAVWLNWGMDETSSKSKGPWYSR